MPNFATLREAAVPLSTKISCIGGAAGWSRGEDQLPLCNAMWMSNMPSDIRLSELGDSLVLA